MRFLRPLVLLIWTSAAGAVPTWELLPNSPVAEFRHEDVSFADPSTGWVVNLDGEIWKTTDGGESWTLQDAPELPHRSVAAVSTILAWTGTLNPVSPLLETTDGGETWLDITSRISGPGSAGICGMCVVNPAVAYAAGRYSGPPRLLKTTDGGLTWVSTDLGAHAATLVDVFFLDELRGFVVGGSSQDLASGHAVVLGTTDGGATWTTRHVTSDPGEWSWKISFPSEIVGYVSVENIGFGAKVLKTTDGGEGWTEIEIASEPLQGIGFVNEERGWVSGRGTTSRTTNGGETWTVYPLDGAINRFRIMTPTFGYAVGSRVYRYGEYVSDAVNADPEQGVPVLSARPNPFGRSTTITCRIEGGGYVTPGLPIRLTVHDVSGRLVRTLVDHSRPGRRHLITWDGLGKDGRPVSSGTYYLRLGTGGRAVRRTVSIIR